METKPALHERAAPDVAVLRDVLFDLVDIGGEKPISHGRRVLVALDRVGKTFEGVIDIEVAVDDAADQ